MAGKTATLVDSFNDSSTGAIWSPFATGTATRTESGGTAVFAPPNATAGSNYAGYDSASTYDLTGSYIYAQVVQTTSGATGAQTYMKISQDGSNYYDWMCEGGTLKARKTIAGSTVNQATAAYDPNIHKWWRISESGGTITWDCSSDGRNYTSFATFANSLTLTAMTVELAAGTFQSEASPGSAVFDNFNINRDTTFGQHLSVGDGMSRSEIAN